MRKFKVHYTPAAQDAHSNNSTLALAEFKKKKEKEAVLAAIKDKNYIDIQSKDNLITNEIKTPTHSEKRTRLEMISDDDESGMLVEVSY